MPAHVATERVLRVGSRAKREMNFTEGHRGITGQMPNPSKSRIVKNMPGQPTRLGADDFAKRSPKARVTV